MEKVTLDIRKQRDDLFNKMLEQLVNQLEKLQCCCFIFYTKILMNESYLN